MAAKRMIRNIVLLWMLLLSQLGWTQKGPDCTISNGKLVLHIPRPCDLRQLDSMVLDFDVNGLELRKALDSNDFTYFKTRGWKVKSRRKEVVMRRSLYSHIDFSVDWLGISFGTEPEFTPGIPSMKLPYGVNHFPAKPGVRKWSDSTALFLLRDFKDAETVVLSGSFNQWDTGAERMMRSDSGWVLVRKLLPGKHLYKFIVDGKWVSDPSNFQVEDDGYNGRNSIYFQTNVRFLLPGFTDHQSFYVSGSFCDWSTNLIPMQRTEAGWYADLFLKDGSYQYKFQDGAFWVEDLLNPIKVDDTQGGFNSVLELGQAMRFSLRGYPNARNVILSGTFNEWNESALRMHRDSSGNWTREVVLAPGNYEYKFIVDGQWITDPQCPDSVVNDQHTWNSIRVHRPNHRFVLHGYAQAREVRLSGTFNDWADPGYRMRREGEDWTYEVYLPLGKTQYKFVVDGQWITDPGNPLWEENEHRTGNSILWISQP